MPLTIPSTAWSSGASSNTMLAALPPSSRVSFLPDPARVRWIALPTSVEPVKATLSTPSWPTRAAPVAPAPVRMLTTPSGSSASWRSSPRRRAVSGVVSAGLRTTVLPAARAGASFQAAISSGKFQGMTWAATPSGGRPAAREGVVELVGPAGVVEEVGRGQGQVDVAGLLDRLAAVHRLQDRELPRPLLQGPGDPVEVLGPLGPRQLRPHLGVGGPGGLDGRVHVLLAGLGDLGQDLLGGRVDGLEGLPGGRLDPPPPDQQAMVGPQLDVVGRLRRGRVVEPPEARRRPLPPPLQLLSHLGPPLRRRRLVATAAQASSEVSGWPQPAGASCPEQAGRGLDGG